MTRGSATLRRSLILIIVMVALGPATLRAASGGGGGKNEFHGASYAEWTQRWWQWYMSLPVGVNQGNDPTGVHLAIGQHPPVWFIAGPLGSSYTRSITIPSGTTILNPLFNYLNDYPCPGPPFEPAPGQSLEDFLQAGAAPIIDACTVHDADIDGSPLDVQRVSAGLFAFTAAADIVTLDPCATGSPQLGISDGWWSVLDPLSVGQHVLHVHTEVPAFGLVTDGTFNITVTPKK